LEPERRRIRRLVAKLAVAVLNSLARHKVSWHAVEFAGTVSVELGRRNFAGPFPKSLDRRRGRRSAVEFAAAP